MHALASDADVMWFRTKVDWWLGVLIAALPFIELGALLSAVRSGDSEAISATVPGVLLVAAIYGLLLIPVRYGLSSESLIVRFGVVRRSIPLASIAEVHPTHNPLSAPALSLDRLAIMTSGRSFVSGLISPAEREKFLTELAARAGLTRDGDRLVR